MISDIKDTILERIKNPFLGSLIVFWLVINWKSVFYLLFSDLSLETRFYNIEHHYYSFFKSYILPPFLAFIYTGYKDLLFDFIEKESRESEKIRRKNNNAVSLDKYNEAAEIATARARVKHISEEYKTRNELTRQIDILEKEKLQEKVNHQEEIENTKKQIQQLEKLKESYKENTNFTYDIFYQNPQIKELKKNMSIDSYKNLGRQIEIILLTTNSNDIDDLNSIIDNLKEHELGIPNYDPNGKFEYFNLSTKGIYVYLRYMYTNPIFSDEKLYF